MIKLCECSLQHNLNGLKNSLNVLSVLMKVQVVLFISRQKVIMSIIYHAYQSNIGDTQSQEHP
jgi:hypothetical protein